MKVRAPVVTILGHVDHGKTTLLDYIRKSNLTKKEVGGITQKIGAYEIDTKIKGYPNSKITFIDTPGHEAFAKLRARGANIADIALLLIDGKDGVMPQTIESIYHIKNAEIPFIVIINKIDLPESNPEKIKNELIKYEVVVEDKGGKIPCLLISAKTGQGVKDLLETILLLAAEKNLQFDPTKSPPKVYIIEAKKDKAGILVSAIIKDGHLRVGDIFYENDKPKKIRSLFNDLGQPINEVFPSTPFVFLGYDQLPTVGTLLSFTPQSVTQKGINVKKTINLQEILQPKKEEKKLSLVLKADSYGSIEALTNALSNIKNCQIVLKGIGDINRSDIFLAKTTKSIVVGFSVKISEEANLLAKQEKIIIKTYQIIYDLLDELKEVSSLLYEKEQKEKSIKGEAKILASFIIEGERVYGVSVTKGKVNLGDPIEIYRQNKFIGKTKLVSLKIRAKRVEEVKKNQEAGMIFSPPLDITIGDVVKSIL